MSSFVAYGCSLELNDGYIKTDFLIKKYYTL